MRLSDILKNKNGSGKQELPKKDDNKSDVEKSPKSLFLKSSLKKEILEKLKEQNLIPTTEESEKSQQVSVSQNEVEKVYGYAVKNVKEIFAGISTGKSEISSVDIMKSAEDIIECCKNFSDEILFYTNYSTPDNYIYSHSVNVAIFSTVLSLEKKFSKGDIFVVALGGLLHDIGMARLLSLSSQKKKFSEEEHEEIKMHSAYVQEEISKIKLDSEIRKKLIDIITPVHERTDGSGYPNNLRDEQINVYSKIISIADVYEAMSHPRPYKERVLPHNALVELIHSAHNKLDSELVKMFVDRVSLFPIGSYVKLNTEEIGVVVGVNKGFPVRPKVRIVLNADKTTAEPQIIDLSKESKIFIVETVDELKLNIPDKKMLLKLRSQYWWVKNVM